MWGIFTPVIVILLLIVSWRAGIAFIATSIAVFCLGSAGAGVFVILVDGDPSPFKWVLMLGALGGAAAWVASKIADGET